MPGSAAVLEDLFPGDRNATEKFDAAMEKVLGEKRQCTATNRKGERCGKPPIRGANVCATHGGGIPLVRQAARMRLLAMAEPAFKVLMELLESDDEMVALKAANSILDRAGHGPKATLALTTDNEEDLSALSEEQLVARAEAVAERCRIAANKARLERGLAVIDVTPVEAKSE